MTDLREHPACGMLKTMKPLPPQGDLTLFLQALNFSAGKHRDQRRKDSAASPYINHPIEVACLLWTVGGVHDEAAILAAILHDTIEDTDTNPEEIRALFGDDVLGLVMEMSDDKSLPKQERKLKQIAHSPGCRLAPNRSSWPIKSATFTISLLPRRKVGRSRGESTIWSGPVMSLTACGAPMTTWKNASTKRWHWPGKSLPRRARAARDHFTVSPTTR